MMTLLCGVWATLGFVAWFRASSIEDNSEGGWVFMGAMSIVYGPLMFLIIRLGSGNWKPTRILPFEQL